MYPLIFPGYRYGSIQEWEIVYRKNSSSVSQVDHLFASANPCKHDDLSQTKFKYKLWKSSKAQYYKISKTLSWYKPPKYIEKNKNCVEPNTENINSLPVREEIDKITEDLKK